MFYQVKHVTRYRFSHPVFCDPLTLRLRPREDATQRLHRFRLDVWPHPAGISEHLDLTGNSIAVAWIPDVTLSLAITTSLLVETLLPLPIHETLDARALRLPESGQRDQRSLAAHYLAEAQPSQQVNAFATSIAEEVDHQTLPFLDTLAERIAEQTECLVTEDSHEPQSPETTLVESRGDCRDLAALFNAACRAVHLPARMVSGYYPSAINPHVLRWHAWSEVYLPGAGWRGFDPFLGTQVSDKHVPVASGRTAADAAPTHGVFGSHHARWQIETQIATTASAADPRKRCPAA